MNPLVKEIIEGLGFQNRDLEPEEIEKDTFFVDFAPGSSTIYNQAVIAILGKNSAVVVHEKGTSSVGPDEGSETVYFIEDGKPRVISQLSAGYYPGFIVHKIDKNFLKRLKGLIGIARIVFKYADLLRNYLIRFYLKNSE